MPAGRVKYVNNTSINPVKSGRDGGIRTHGPLTPSQVRYQAALHPDLATLHLTARAAGRINVPRIPQGFPVRGLSVHRWTAPRAAKPTACDAQTRRYAARSLSGAWV